MRTIYTDTKFCYMELYLPIAYKMNNIQVECEKGSTCVFVMNATTELSGKVYLEGETDSQLIVNIENLKTDKIDFRASAGSISINHLNV